MRLYAAGATENTHTAIEDLQRTIYLDREVHVSGCVDNIQTVFVPFATGRSGLNRNTALLFLVHEVRRGFAIMDFTGLMNLAGKLENAFRRRRFTRVDVGKNTDISVKA